jgi:hypothetical protein
MSKSSPFARKPKLSLDVFHKHFANANEKTNKSELGQTTSSRMAGGVSSVWRTTAAADDEQPDQEKK